MNPEEKEHIRSTIERKIEKARREIKELEELTQPIAPKTASEGCPEWMPSTTRV